MNPRFLALIFLVYIFPHQSQAQSFEGKILFQNTYHSKVPAINDEQLTEFMGARQEYLIKGGDYISKINGTMMQWQLYRNQDNKLYNKLSSSAAIIWYDAAISSDSVISATINRNVEKVLDRPCDELILTMKSGVQKYYFDPSIKIDPALYTHHKFGNWYEIISRTKSLPLKAIVETAQLSYESAAVEISPSVIDPAVFVLPAGIELKKG